MASTDPKNLRGLPRPGVPTRIIERWSKVPAPRAAGRGSVLFRAGVPLLMGGAYLTLIFPRYCQDPRIIPEHLIILTLWIVSTIGLASLLERPMDRAKSRIPYLPLSLVTALSYYVLYFIYVCAAIGTVAWGSPPPLFRVYRFLPELLPLSRQFMIPASTVAWVLVAPLVFLVLLYEWEGFAITGWLERFEKRFNPFALVPRKTKIAAACVVWAVGTLMVATADTSIDRFGEFSHDPVVCFFKDKPGRIEMTRERIFWAQRDMEARQSVVRKTPRVHNVIIICVDALRADHLPIYGYTRPLTPFLSGFLRSAHARRVDWGLSNGLETFTGVMAINASKGSTSLSQYSYTLADYLADQGFQSSLIMSGDHYWYIQNGNFGKKVHSVVDGGVNSGPRGACDDELVVNTVSNLPVDDGGYHYFYIHLLSTHQVGVFDAKFARYKPVLNFIDPLFSPGHLKRSDEVHAIVNLYDDKILQLDDELKRTLLPLEKKGYLRDYIAVLTGDHGQLLGERGEFGHGYYCPVQAIHVPMVFFSSKPIPAFQESRFAVQMDIAPTLVDISGLNIPSSWQGQSLLRKRTDPWTYHLTPSNRPGAEGAVVYHVPGKTLKYSRALVMNRNFRSEWLFDLEKDPLEQDNLVGRAGQDLLNQFRSRAGTHFTSH